MKLKFVLFCFIFLTVFSCGNQIPKIELKVSKMSLSGQNFPGGLVVYAKSGDNFIVANSTSGDLLSIDIKYGTWNFLVIGWEGSTPFSGTAYCANTTSTISETENKIFIKVTPENCNNPIFTLPEHTASNGTSFKPLKIYNCSTLYNNNSSPLLSTSTVATFESGFCGDNLALPSNQRESAKSIKISIPGNLNPNYNFPDISSSCLTTEEGPVNVGALPLKNIPFIIKLFETDNCTGLSKDNLFPNGFLGYNAVASVLNSLPNLYNALFLSFNSMAVPAQITSHFVTDSWNDVLNTNSSVTIGSVLNFQLNAQDPNNSPIQYKFMKVTGGNTEIISDWSSNNQINYTIPAIDQGIGNVEIKMALRNSDGINYHSTLFGDAVQTWSYQVVSSLLPSVINSIDVSDASQQTLQPNSVLDGNDIMHISANATDPNNLPIQYKFFYSIGSIKNVIREWGTSKSTSFTIPNSILGLGNLKIWVATRNNDGINYESALLGDGAAEWDFQAPGQYLPGQITSFTVRDPNNNLLPNNTIVPAGQQITIQTNATDPNSIPLQYRFLKEVAGTLTTIQDWSSSNQLIYNIPSVDLGLSGFKILVAVKNTDGRDYLGAIFGDVVQFWSFQVSGSIQPASLSSVVVQNSAQQIVAQNSSLTPGSVITINATASDPNGLPIQYKFLKGINSSTTVIQDWSSLSQASYTIPSTDQGLGGLSIWVAVRNSDGINYSSSLFGDNTSMWSYAVPGSPPAVINSVVITNSSSQILTQNSVLAENDVINIQVSASDPGSRPIEYKFMSGVGSSTTVISDWSSSSSAIFTVPNSVLGLSGLKLWVAVRNDDGINYSSSLFGDANFMWSYQAPGPYLPTTITTLSIKDQNNNILPAGTTLTAGQQITVEVTATDPNNLPIQYKFLKGINSSTTIIQDWSSSSSAVYTIPSGETGLGGLKIWVAVRNNDGRDYNSSLFGDGTLYWSYSSN